MRFRRPLWAVTASYFIAFVTLVAGTAEAAVINYDLNGVLDSQLGNYAPGTAFTGSFSYETDGNGDTFDPTLGIVSDLVGYYDALLVSLSIGGETVTSFDGRIVVENNINAGDRLTAEGTALGTIGGLVNPFVRFSLTANGGGMSTVFSDDSLPNRYLNPSDFTANPRLVVFSSSTGTFVGGGVIDEFAAAANPVPEPGTLALLSLGSIGLVAGKIRTRRKAIAAV